MKVHTVFITSLIMQQKQLKANSEDYAPTVEGNSGRVDSENLPPNSTTRKPIIDQESIHAIIEMVSRLGVFALQESRSPMQPCMDWLFGDTPPTKPSLELLRGMVDKPLSEVIASIVETYSMAGGKSPKDFRAFLSDCSFIVVFHWAEHAAKCEAKMAGCEKVKYFDSYDPFNWFQCWDELPNDVAIDRETLSSDSTTDRSMWLRFVREKGGCWWSDKESAMLAEADRLARVNRSKLNTQRVRRQR